MWYACGIKKNQEGLSAGVYSSVHGSLSYKMSLKMHTVLFNMKLLWAVLQQGLHNVVSQQHCSATYMHA